MTSRINGNRKGSKAAKSTTKLVRPTTKTGMTVRVKGPAQVNKAVKSHIRAPAAIKQATKVSNSINAFGTSGPTQNYSLVHFAKDVEMARSIGWTSAAPSSGSSSPALATVLQGKIGETTSQMPQETAAVTGVKVSTKSSGSLYNGLMSAGILAAGTTVGVMIVGVLTGLF